MKYEDIKYSTKIKKIKLTSYVDIDLSKIDERNYFGNNNKIRYFHIIIDVCYSQRLELGNYVIFEN